MSFDTAFHQFPSIETERLHMRALVPEDAPALFEIKSDAQVTVQYGREPHLTISDTQGWMQRIQDNYERHQGLFWGITLTGQKRIIGSATFWNIDPEYHYVELGYELNPAFSRQGYMTEALSALLAYGFTDLGLRRIEACPLAENLLSINLLLKLGFSLEGTLRQRIYFRGRFIDQQYYGLLREEWMETN